ncbi:MAG: putative rane-anchored protein [Gemmatimonadetes bacterium]|nr:putative rane-anchored protein [Gemmatimonadota bacterium]
MTTPLRTAPVRVPEITAYFWIVKILTTGAGETTSDFLGHHVNPAVVAGVGAIVLAASLVLQFRMHRYVAWTYWLAVSMVAIVGTMAADVFHGLGVPYFASTIVLALALAAIFAAWYRSERTLSIHSITTRRREAYYWATVIATFALGTAAGDMTATTFGWGYLTSGIVFAVAIVVVGIAHYVARRALTAEHRHQSTNAVLAFWLAYILTRPLGASFADWMGAPRAKGGLEWGEGTVSIALFVVIFLFVAYLAVTRKDAPADVREPPS